MKKTGPIAKVVKDLENSFGPVDMISAWFPFDYTDYYEAEMGKPLFRRIFVFKELVEQDSLLQHPQSLQTDRHGQAKFYPSEADSACR